MGTGIGKDGYSLIGQEKTDAVLGNEPEGRRMVLKEAAGITRLKEGKNKSIKKLQETLDNLERVQDLLAVLKRQKASLSDDLEKHCDYKEIYGKGKPLDEDLFVLEYQSFQGQKAKA